ncbi:MAG: putative superfamily hydrolase, metal-dependent [Clostridia bacterium]|jgi:hypothetical protein|nr:putative superfamily hydrolase, metal-dependent [Clostridia bacterium]
MSLSTHAIKMEMIKYFGSDVRRINHALKVHSFSKLILISENVSNTEQFIIETAALLHDIGIKEAERKYHSSSGHYQEIEGPPVAKQLLSLFSIDESILNRILYLIGSHHSYSKIDSLDFQILVESDFLVNIYEDGIDKAHIVSLKEKYFKTASGKDLIASMFL